MSLEKLTKILTENNDYVSGEKIAELLGVSRNCIWKYVRELKRIGYNIDSVPNKGYKLINSGNNYSPEIIKRHLKQQLDIYCYDSVTSTNTLLKEFAQTKKIKDKTVVISDKQTKGKGRTGKSFYSPSSSGLYMSIILHPDFKASEAYLITAAAAVSVCNAIEKADSTLSPKIKWVNDVFCDNKKVCGILTEASVDFESGNLEYAILGIGINLFTDLSEFPEELQGIVGSVFKEKISDDFRNLFAASVLNEFFEIYDKNDNSFICDYKKRSFLIGKRVTSKIGEGIVEGISDRCELILKKDTGEKIYLSAGEVSVKEAE